MKSFLTASLLAGSLISPTGGFRFQAMQAQANGLIVRPSKYSVDETVNRLKSALSSRGVTLFAVIDHSGEAEKVGMKLRPTKLLIFGNPKAGTPLMEAAPTIAIDLPLKILVWEDEHQKVWLSYNSPEYLSQRHHLPMNLAGPLGSVEGLVAAAGIE